jgi:outer membrane protein assembly factor BamB
VHGGGAFWNNWNQGSVSFDMNTLQAGGAAPPKTLRPWLGAVALLLLLLRFALPAIVPEAFIIGVVGALLGGLAVVVWWVFFSRAPLPERWGAIVLMIAAELAVWRIVDKSIATGMMGYMFPMYSIPVLGIAFAAWAMFSSWLSAGPRRASMAATILLACGSWALLRTEGMRGSAAADIHWRWSKTPEEHLLLESAVLPPVPPAAPRQPAAAVKTIAFWPGFRGPGRDSVIPGLRIKTDWSASPPVELWRRPIGPGWSSFAVRGDLLYTQEQRGEDEIVSCYNAATGNPVWAHRDAARFWESNAGAGPRATPTLHGDRVYAFGATGILNVLDAGTGAAIWSQNAAADTSTKVPGWGFANSPLVVRDMVIVAVSGKLAAYDAATGESRWSSPTAGGSYSSPQLAKIDGVEQILLNGALGITSVSPTDGTVLWKYAWPSDTRIMQPAVLPDGDLLITTGDAMGGGSMRRIAVSHGASGWVTEERWTSSGLKPSFNDFVVHDGNVFGFDGTILACIDAKDGKRKWKGGRYGAGQLILLRDQGVLLVLSEEGGLALVKAAADKFTELARFPALEGKTWNHPVLAGDRLLVRNGSEMAGFRLSLAGR